MNKRSLLSLVMLAITATSVCAEDIEARAVIKAIDRATLSGELVARIVKLPKRAGEGFKKGDNLVMLDCSVFEAQKDKVSAERQVAQVKVQNARQLNKLRSIGAVEVALAEAELKKSDAELRIASLNTQRCNIKAPYDGKIVRLMANEFEIVGQQPLIEIVGTQRLEAEIIVPAQAINWLKTGSPVQLKLDETGKEVTADISYINPVIDPVSQTLQLRSILNNVQDAVPGMSATVKLKKPDQ